MALNNKSIALLTTRFPHALEREYQLDLQDEKIRLILHGNWLAVALYLSFCLLDIWAIPSNAETVWAIRFSVTALTLSVSWLAFRSPRLIINNYIPIISGMCLIWGGGILAMVYISTPTDIAWSVYYAGLILSITATYVWTFLPPLLASLIGMSIIGTYLFIAVFVQSMWHSPFIPTLMANSFFLVGANLVGIFAATSRDRFAREAFTLRHSLQKELIIKDKEKQKSDYLANHDSLTNLPNRSKLYNDLSTLIQEANEANEKVGLLFIDLDNFKPINDTYGHEAGDLVLKAIAERIQNCVRADDTVARFAGDEFIVILPLKQNHRKIMKRIGETILNSISNDIQFEGSIMNVGASIGGAIYPEHAETIDDLFVVADQYMYHSKTSGKSTFSLAPL